MSPTRNPSDRLATVATFREAAVIRSAPITARLVERARIDRFLMLFRHAPRKPDWYYDFTREEPRRRHPAEFERSLIHDGIRAGYITREQVIQYRASQLQDDLAAFGSDVEPEEAIYVQFMTETAEAVDWATKAKGMPTRENIERAQQEIGELAVVAEIKCAALARGCAS